MKIKELRVLKAINGTDSFVSDKYTITKTDSGYEIEDKSGYYEEIFVPLNVIHYVITHKEEKKPASSIDSLNIVKKAKKVKDLGETNE